MAHVANFLLGMTAAYLLRRYPHLPMARRWYFSFVPAGCLILVVAAFPYFDTPGSLAVRLLLFIAFLSFLYGNTLFGLLSRRWARVLGAISYSIYLLHGVIVFLAATAMNHFLGPLGTLGPRKYWMGMAVTGTVVVLIAAVTYRFLEHPFIRSGPKLAPIRP
jgi:peptidoglycan/LPS O-acetylase OafA/YrhL